MDEGKRDLISLSRGNGSEMDIIQCITCGEKWTHGAWPDNGGGEAHAHEQKYANAKPRHIVLTGNVDVLAARVEEERAKGGKK